MEKFKDFFYDSPSIMVLLFTKWCCKQRYCLNWRMNCCYCLLFLLFRLPPTSVFSSFTTGESNSGNYGDCVMPANGLQRGKQPRCCYHYMCIIMVSLIRPALPSIVEGSTFIKSTPDRRSVNLMNNDVMTEASTPSLSISSASQSQMILHLLPAHFNRKQFHLHKVDRHRA